MQSLLQRDSGPDPYLEQGRISKGGLLFPTQRMNKRTVGITVSRKRKRLSEKLCWGGYITEMGSSVWHTASQTLRGQGLHQPTASLSILQEGKGHAGDIHEIKKQGSLRCRSMRSLEKGDWK